MPVMTMVIPRAETLRTGAVVAGDRTLGNEVAELLGVLIRNRCVSRFEGISSLGNESVNADTLRSVVEGPGVDVDWHEAIDGRASLVARIAGSDPTAPSLAFMGHTDVVPADEAHGWTRDPFGGELVDGEVWGRGAVDMLNQTAAMALTVRRLADEGFRPRGDLVFWAVPDEENGGYQGAKQVIESNHDLVRTDFALTEVGGAARRTPNGLVVEASVSDKGMGGVYLAFKGRQSHASLPHGSDNPLLKLPRLSVASMRGDPRCASLTRGAAGSTRKASMSISPRP